MVSSDFADRVVVVTGGAGGIGAAICESFCARGATVAVVDIDGVAAQQMRDHLTAQGGRAWSAACDISDAAQVQQVFAAAEEALGAPDVLINNAGINPRTDPLELTVELWNTVLAVNLTGYFLCSQAAGRQMVARGSGAIVNLTSIAARSALGRGNFAFAVAKAGVEAATRELAVEWASRGVRVNAVAPCQVSTAAFTQGHADLVRRHDDRATDYQRGIPAGRPATPQEVANAVLYLASDQACMITGVVLPVDGGNLAMNAGGSTGPRTFPRQPPKDPR